MKIQIIIISIILLIANSIVSAELKFKLSGKDEYPFFEKYEENSMFMLYKNEAQFTTNSTLFGIHKAAAVIEMIDGKQSQNLLMLICKMNCYLINLYFISRQFIRVDDSQHVGESIFSSGKVGHVYG